MILIIDGQTDRSINQVHRPDNDDDAIKDVVGIPQVFKEAEGRELQDHLQGEHAGEDNVADLEDVGQFVGLRGSTREGT